MTASSLMFTPNQHNCEARIELDFDRQPFPLQPANDPLPDALLQQRFRHFRRIEALPTAFGWAAGLSVVIYFAPAWIGAWKWPILVPLIAMISCYEFINARATGRWTDSVPYIAPDHLRPLAAALSQFERLVALAGPLGSLVRDRETLGQQHRLIIDGLLLLRHEDTVLNVAEPRWRAAGCSHAAMLVTPGHMLQAAWNGFIATSHSVRRALSGKEPLGACELSLILSRLVSSYRIVASSLELDVRALEAADTAAAAAILAKPSEMAQTPQFASAPKTSTLEMQPDRQPLVDPAMPGAKTIGLDRVKTLLARVTTAIGSREPPPPPPRLSDGGSAAAGHIRTLHARLTRRRAAAVFVAAIYLILAATMIGGVVAVAMLNGVAGVYTGALACVVGAMVMTCYNPLRELKITRDDDRYRAYLPNQAADEAVAALTAAARTLAKPQPREKWRQALQAPHDRVVVAIETVMNGRPWRSVQGAGWLAWADGPESSYPPDHRDLNQATIILIELIQRLEQQVSGRSVTTFREVETTLMRLMRQYRAMVGFIGIDTFDIDPRDPIKRVIAIANKTSYLSRASAGAAPRGSLMGLIAQLTGLLELLSQHQGELTAADATELTLIRDRHVPQLEAAYIAARNITDAPQHEAIEREFATSLKRILKSLMELKDRLTKTRLDRLDIEHRFIALRHGNDQDEIN